MSANDSSPNQDKFIRFAIFPRVNGAPEDSDVAALRGFVVIQDPDGNLTKLAIESSNRPGIRLELQTLLERYVGQNVEVCLFESECKESRLGVAAAEFLGCPVRKLTLKWPRRDQFKPFSKPFLGRRFYSYSPDWYQPVERGSALRALNFEDYRV